MATPAVLCERSLRPCCRRVSRHLAHVTVRERQSCAYRRESGAKWTWLQHSAIASDRRDHVAAVAAIMYDRDCALTSRLCVSLWERSQVSMGTSKCYVNDRRDRAAAIKADPVHMWLWANFEVVAHVVKVESSEHGSNRSVMWTVSRIVPPLCKRTPCACDFVPTSRLCLPPWERSQVNMTLDVMLCERSSCKRTPCKWTPCECNCALTSRSCILPWKRGQVNMATTAVIYTRSSRRAAAMQMDTVLCALIVAVRIALVAKLSEHCYNRMAVWVILANVLPTCTRMPYACGWGAST